MKNFQLLNFTTKYKNIYLEYTLYMNVHQIHKNKDLVNLSELMW